MENQPLTGPHLAVIAPVSNEVAGIAHSLASVTMMNRLPHAAAMSSGFSVPER